MAKKKNPYTKLVNIGKNQQWVSFTCDNHPYSLAHWSLAGLTEEEKDAWVLQDEMEFTTMEFATIEEAVAHIEQTLPPIDDILA